MQDIGDKRTTVMEGKSMNRLLNNLSTATITNK
jgi:hypothetical protein